MNTPKQFVFIILLLCQNGAIFCRPVENKKAIFYLIRYGYMQINENIESVGKSSINYNTLFDEAVTNAIKQYQVGTASEILKCQSVFL